MWEHNLVSNTPRVLQNTIIDLMGKKLVKKTRLECPLKATLPHKRPLSFTKATTAIDKKDFTGLFSLLIDEKIILLSIFRF